MYMLTVKMKPSEIDKVMAIVDSDLFRDAVVDVDGSCGGVPVHQLDIYMINLPKIAGLHTAIKALGLTPAIPVDVM